MGEDYTYWVGNATVGTDVPTGWVPTHTSTATIGTIRFDDPPDIAVPAYTPTPQPCTPGAMALSLPAE